MPRLRHRASTLDDPAISRRATSCPLPSSSAGRTRGQRRKPWAVRRTTPFVGHSSSKARMACRVDVFFTSTTTRRSTCAKPPPLALLPEPNGLDTRVVSTPSRHCLVTGKNLPGWRRGQAATLARTPGPGSCSSRRTPLSARPSRPAQRQGGGRRRQPGAAVRPR